MTKQQALVLASLLLPASLLGAQSFVPKTALAAGGVTGCSAFAAPGPRVAPGLASDAEAQQLIEDGQDAALQGEHARARDAFLKAQALLPGNARLAYSLARAHEALTEPTEAVQQYCRYLALAGNPTDGDDVRGRIVRLTPASELARLEEARANFQSGIALLRRKQYAAADSVFGGVLASVPNAPEPVFNRALSRAARGERQNAMLDFERYLELEPQATDRGNVRAAMSRLPDGVYGPGQAFGYGLLIPGLGQMTTGRPILGVLALGLAGGGVAMGLVKKSEDVVQRYTDPFGNSYTDTLTRTSRPRLTLGVGTALAVWLVSAMESSAYARRSRARAEAIIARTPLAAGDRRLGLAFAPLPGDRVGIGFSLR
jgi:tetratricopeptide (TPR) repeat protein